MIKKWIKQGQVIRLPKTIENIDVIFIPNYYLVTIAFILLLFISSFILKFVFEENQTEEERIIDQNFITYKNDIENEFKNKQNITSLSQVYSSTKTDIDVNKVKALDSIQHLIALKFITTELSTMKVEENVLSFLDAETIKFAMMENIYSNIPASVTLAQAAIETGWGSSVPENNYFGIKDKFRTTKKRLTDEWFTNEEIKLNKKIIKSIHKNQSKQIGGIVHYRCVVEDSFCEYKTKWESFRGHSDFLRSDKRYAELFQKGQKDYRQWAKYMQRSGYATALNYGDLIERVIYRYKLYLLD